MLLQCSPSAAAASAFMVKSIQAYHTKQLGAKRAPCAMRVQCRKRPPPRHYRAKSLFTKQGARVCERVERESLTAAILLRNPQQC